MEKRTLFPIIGLIVLAVGWAWYQLSPNLSRRKPIKVGILHSLSGPMAFSETSVKDATLLAIEEINERGGVLGRPIQPVVVDGKSDWPTFGREAEKLIVDAKVAVVFGCWTSASRKTVKPVFERHDHLLFYPVQHEGLEQSPNIIYTGAAPNQQLIPAVKWCFDHVGTKFFLIGSDYIFPRSANAIARDQIMALGGQVVGEEYILLENRDFSEVVQRIVAARPDVILNTINGGSNVDFFRELRRAGITPEKIPTMSLSIAEEELLTLLRSQVVGDYACWNYFQSVDTEENRVFVRRFKQRFGEDRVTDDAMEAAYFGVHLWAQAVEEVSTLDVSQVRKAIRRQTLRAPEGLVSINAENHHTAKIVRIGRVRADGQFDIVYSSETPIQPVTYPIYRSGSEWNQFVEKMHVAWGGAWSNPGITPEIVKRMAAEKSGLIEELARNGTIISEVQTSNEKNRLLRPTEINHRDMLWQRSKGDDENCRWCSTNEAAKVLLALQEQHPHFHEVFVTDAVGLNVAMTNRTSDCYQADEQWWIESYAGGKGKTCFGQLQYDRSAEVWGTTICVPIINEEQETIGIIKAFLSISDVLEIEDLNR